MKQIIGDILELLPPGGVMFHQVNTLGKFGAGLALNIRKKWPTVAADYETFCATHSPCLGDYKVSEVPDAPSTQTRRRYVAHLFGQDSIGRDKLRTNYTALAEAMQQLRCDYQWRPCYFPYKMGCGLAGGNWDFVQILIEENFPDATIVKYEKPAHTES